MKKLNLVFFSIFMTLACTSRAISYHFEVATPDEVRDAGQKVLATILPEIEKGLKVKHSPSQNPTDAKELYYEDTPTVVIATAEIESILPSNKINLSAYERTYEIQFDLELASREKLKGSLLMDVVTVRYVIDQHSETDGLKVISTLTNPACTGTFARFPQIRVNDQYEHTIFSKEKFCFASKLPL